VSVYESASYQWREGERRLTSAPSERRACLERVTEAVVAELRRRLGGKFYAEELAEMYRQGTPWGLQLAIDLAPENPWAWDQGVVVDAAFGRYLKEAADYGGGRLTWSERA
jgi:hypothetical protein